MQVALRQQITKQARRSMNRGRSFQKRGKGLKTGAKSETAGATAHASGVAAIMAGATMVLVGASVHKIRAKGFMFGATRLTRTLAPQKFGAVIVKTGATAEKSGQSSRTIRQQRKEAGLRERIPRTIARLRGCAVARLRGFRVRR
jgi:hypothetical protein